MKQCLVASSNEHKIKEITAILQPLGWQILSPEDLGGPLEVVEDANSYVANASLKAQAYAKAYPDYYILADDSGLSIDALDGYPGIYSSRYGGEETTYEEKFSLIWQELRKLEVPEAKWQASFYCAIAWLAPGTSEPVFFVGELKGLIVPEARGEQGFGYDPIFYLPDLGQTTAELSPEEKNKLSHRARALAQLEAYLRANK